MITFRPRWQNLKQAARPLVLGPKVATEQKGTPGPCGVVPVDLFSKLTSCTLREIALLEYSAGLNSRQVIRHALGIAA